MRETSQGTRNSVGRIMAMLLIGGVYVGPLGELPSARAAFPGQNGRLVYVAYCPNSGSPYLDTEIRTVTADGARHRYLTQSPHWEADPEWSPDGQRIAFSLVEETDYQADIWVMDRLGAGKHAITEGNASDSDPTWSPDGSKIAFVRAAGGNDTEIFKMNSDGSGLRRLTDNSVDDLSPEWSPTSPEIVFVRRPAGSNTRNDIWKMSANGSEQTKIRATVMQDPNPDWAPGGDRLVFAGALFDPENPLHARAEVHVISSAGAVLETLTQTRADESHAVWSPDGNEVAFVRGDTVVKKPLDGSAIAQFPEAACTGPESLDWQPVSVTS